MLDLLFMKSMNIRGRRIYLIGTIVAGLAVFLFGIISGIIEDEGTSFILIGILVLAIVAWGSLCAKRWPVSLSPCPWCAATNNTPDLDTSYVCSSCGKQFLLEKNGLAKKA